MAYPHKYKARKMELLGADTYFLYNRNRTSIGVKRRKQGKTGKTR